MYHLTNQDFRDVLDLIDVANSHPELTGMRESILHTMQRVFRMESANFFLVDSHSGEINITGIANLGIDNRYLEPYVQYYCRYDPFRTEQALRKTVAQTGEVCPYSRWINLEYYNDFIKPQNIHHELVIYLRSGSKLLGVIALFRPKRQPNFSQREMLKAYILAPHVTTALENISLLSKIEEERNLLKEMSESRSCGILLLDKELQPIYSNSKAKDSCLSLSHGQPAWPSGEGEERLPIPSEIIQDCLALKETFQSRDQIAPPRRQRIMRGGESRRFQVESSLVRQPFKNVSSPCFLVSLHDLPETCEIQGEALKEKHNLTNREIDIVRCVFQGLTNEDVAKKLCISRFTVENHLKHIFEKTGVKNRTELASLIKLA